MKRAPIVVLVVAVTVAALLVARFRSSHRHIGCRGIVELKRPNGA